MQTLTTANTTNSKELKGLNGSIPLREQKARRYIVDSFTGKMPSLIPLALDNESVVKLASYLLKYTTGSKHILYQYVFGINRFCNWTKETPDEMVKTVSTGKTAIDDYVLRIDDFI